MGGARIIQGFGRRCDSNSAPTLGTWRKRVSIHATKFAIGASWSSYATVLEGFYQVCTNVSEGPIVRVMARWPGFGAAVVTWTRYEAETLRGTDFRPPQFMSILSSAARPRASLTAFREVGLSLHSRSYAAKAKGGPMKQHCKSLRSHVFPSMFTEPSATELAQPRGSREPKAIS